MRPLIALAIPLIALCGCSDDIKGYVNDATLTASGRITEVKDRVEQAIQPVADTINDVNDRVESVQEGVRQVREGAEKLESAITGQ